MNISFKPLLVVATSHFLIRFVRSLCRDNFSAGSDDGYLGQAEEDFSQFHLNNVPSVSAHHSSQAHSFQHPNPHHSHNAHNAHAAQPTHNSHSHGAHNSSFAPTPSQYAPPQPMANLSYRVRGGPGPLSNSSQNSLQSSGGWVVPAEEEAAAAEEMLKQELKKAKVGLVCDGCGVNFVTCIVPELRHRVPSDLFSVLTMFHHVHRKRSRSNRRCRSGNELKRRSRRQIRRLR